MNCVNLAKAFSGFISPPAGLKKYTSSISQTKRSFASCQPQLTPLDRIPAEPHFCLPPVLRTGPLFLFAFSDRWGPFGVTAGEGMLVSGGTSDT